MTNVVKIVLGVMAGVTGVVQATKTAQDGKPDDTSPRQHQRRRRDLVDLPRSAALSHLHRAAEAVAPPNHPPVSTFAPSAIWDWVRHYLAYVFQKKHLFPAHTASPQNAMYSLADENGSENVRVAIAGDWGTGTDDAMKVATRMQAFVPHFTIHIGDVYYVGDPPEINENCLGIKNPENNYDPVIWPIGTCGSFAMNGNHEMYANGNGYFNLFLPRLGLRNAAGKMLGQQTSFFCLQNSHWRIIAIDTGYNSTGIPILAHIPLINSIPGVGGDCKLRDELIAWLTSVVLPHQDNRGLILLSHHQYHSGFEGDYRKPAQQLWQAGVQRKVLWLWGHEHRLAGYDLYGKDQLKCYGRCVGHGGMPIDRLNPQHDPAPRFWDNRQSTESYGVNGHVNLDFAGPKLTTTYEDLDGKKLLQEEWAVNSDGDVQLLSMRKLTSDPDFHA